MNLVGVLSLFAWRGVYRVGRRDGSTLADLLLGWFSPIRSPYVAYARLASEVVALVSASVYIQAVFSDGGIGLAERIGLACASLFEMLGSAFRGKAAGRSFVSVASAVALVFASGLVSSFGGPDSWEQRHAWLLYPTFHVAVYHCSVRLYLIKADVSSE